MSSIWPRIKSFIQCVSYFKEKIQCFSVKGLDTSLAFVVALVIGLVAVVAITVLLTQGFSGLEEFVENNINLTFGGDN